MISIKEIQTAIVDGLQEVVKCPVIMANQVSPVPKYPYLSFTITSLVVSNAKTWSVDAGGTFFKPLSQIWSITIQSDKVMESNMLALAAYNWFSQTGNRYLSDNDIVVERVGNITNRDNLLSVEYEYRLGFDVTFSLMHISKLSNEDGNETIDAAKIENNYGGI